MEPEDIAAAMGDTEDRPSELAKFYVQFSGQLGIREVMNRYGVREHLLTDAYAGEKFWYISVTSQAGFAAVWLKSSCNEAIISEIEALPNVKFVTMEE